MSEAAVPAGLSRLHSDERLTRRAVGGDERAFAAIFRRYHQSLYRFCLAIVGNPEDAQDALQNTMIKVMRALPGEERAIALKPWLYRIAHNESIDLLRRRRETRELDSEQAAPGYGLAEDVVTRERLRRLLVDLRELPERQREVLVMREMGGLGFEEIGVALETSGAVARQTLYEARQSLRQMEEGREMDCDAVTRALSDDDGRVIRRRDVRAHMRSCAGCREFRDGIKSRRRDFAALAPLPTVAAAGMLQGLVGGGSQGATGGGVAAALGGGAAKTIATSAVVKGVATVAVVAAVGVTAADRSGAIHLGLPGEKSTKSTPVSPAVEHHDSVAPGQSAAGATGKIGTGRSPAAKANGAGARSESKPGVAPVSGGHGHGAEDANPHSSTEAQGPPVEQAVGGTETQQPATAAGGQAKAAGDQSHSEDSAGKGNGKAPDAPPGKPSTSPGKGPPSSSPPEETPANPPQGAAPSLPPQAHQPTPPGREAEPPAAGTPSNPGKGAEKGKGH
jgi:RNA polymerase sigma factor (sigma-70 family)